MRVDEHIDRISLERRRELRLAHHCGDSFGNGAIEPFGNSVLVRLSTDGVLAFNTVFNTEKIKLTAAVLSTLIVAQNPDLATGLVLDPCLELFECIECIQLVAKQFDRSEASGIIDEGYPIAVTLRSRSRQRSMQVGMNECKRTRVTISRLVDDDSMLFPHDTWLTDRIRRVVIVDAKAGNHVARDKLLKVSAIEDLQ